MNLDEIGMKIQILSGGGAIPLVSSQRNDELGNGINLFTQQLQNYYKMKKVTVEVTDKMEAAIEAFYEIWKDDYTNEGVLMELLKTGIEHSISTEEKEDKEKYEIISKIMGSKGYKNRLWDME